LKTKELFSLDTGGSEKVLTEKDDFFEGVFDIFIFLNDVDGVVNIGFVIGLGLDEFVEVESISG
jgi:hypothetical protein